MAFIGHMTDGLVKMSYGITDIFESIRRKRLTIKEIDRRCIRLECQGNDLWSHSKDSLYVSGNKDGGISIITELS